MRNSADMGTPAEHATPRELYFALGQAFLQRQLHVKAVDSFQHASEEEGNVPSVSEILLNLAAAHEQSGDRGHAFRAYLEAAASAPELIETILKHLHRLLTTETAAAEGTWLQSQWATRMKNASLSTSNRARVMRFLGRASLYERKYQNALEIFQLAVQEAPEDARDFEGLGEALRRTGHFAEAIDALNRAYGLAETDGPLERLRPINVKLVAALVDAGRYEAALSRIREIPWQDDVYAFELRVSLGRCYLALGHPEKAREEAETASHERPFDVQPHVLRAEALIALREYAEALKATNDTLQRDPLNTDILFDKARALIEGQTDLEQAKRLLRQYVEKASAEGRAIQDLLPERAMQPEDGNTHYFLAQCYRIFECPPKRAMDEVDRALKLELSGQTKYPNAPALQLKAELLQSLGEREESGDYFFQAGCDFSWRNQYGEAVAQFQQAANLRPRHTRTYWHWAEALRLLSYTPSPPYVDEAAIKECLTVWETGVAIGHPDSACSWAYLSRALLEEQRSRLPGAERWTLGWRAVAYLEQAILLDDQDASRWAELSRFLRLRKAESTALEAARRVRELDPQNVSGLEELGILLLNRGEFEEADGVVMELEKVEPKAWTDALKAFKLVRRGQREQALELISGSIAASPDVVWYHDLRALCLSTAEGELPPQAQQEYQWVWDRYGKSEAEDEVTCATAAYKLGKVDEAISIFERLLRDPSQAGTALRKLGLCYLARGDLEPGEKYLNDGVMHLTTNLRELEDLLDFYLKFLERSSYQRPQGAALREEVLPRIRRNITAQIQALRVPRSGREELALVIEALRANGETEGWPWIGAHATLARVLGGERRWSETAAVYQMLQTRGDRFHEAQTGLRKSADALCADGDRLLKQRQPCEALNRFTEVLKLNLGGDDQSSQADLHCRIGCAYLGLNDVAGARTHFVQALDLYRDHGVPDPGARLGEVCATVLADTSQYWFLDDEWGTTANLSTTEPKLQANLWSARKSLANYLHESYKLSAKAAPSDSMYAVVTPVAVEFGQAIMSELDNPNSALLKSYLPEMRNRIEQETGVRVPGVRVRGNDSGDLPPGSYLIMLDEVPLVLGTIQPGMRYCPSPRQTLTALGIPEAALREAPHPVSGEPGCWVEPEGWNLVVAAGLEFWAEPIVYAVYHLEATLRQNLAYFLGIQEVQDLLDRWRQSDRGATLIEAVLSNDAALLRFARVLQALVAERVPITSWEDILQGFGEIVSTDQEIEAIVRGIRLQQRLHLPGNQITARRLELSAQLEKKLYPWLRHEGSKVFFALPPKETQDLLSEIRELVNGQERQRGFVLVTPSSELRLFVRRLVELEFPDLMVMCEEEVVTLRAG